MIVYFFLIILVNIISGDDLSDTEYIETLPASVKKGLLDKVARRILNEVPEVNSRDTDINGDILADKLEEQSEFVKRILKQEVASLKARRRDFRKLKKFRKSGNNNIQLSGVPDSENLEKNDTQISDLEAKESVNDKMDADAGHIDLTMRAARSKRDDGFLNVNDSTPKDGLSDDEHVSHDGSFVPVPIEIDGENDDKEPIKDSNGNTTKVFKEQKSSNEDIQIRSSKQGKENKSEKDNKEPSVVATEKADNVDKTTSQSHVNSETTLKKEDTSLKMFFGRRSEDLALNKTDEVVGTATVDVSTVSDSLNTNSNDTNTSEDYTTMPNIVETTVADVKESSLETNENTNNKTDSVFKYSSESYLENPIIDSKGRKNLEILNSNETTTQTTKEASVKSKPDVNDTSVSVTKDPHNHYSEITTLPTIETPYVATTSIIQPSVEKSTNVVSDVRSDLRKDFEATDNDSKEDKLTVTEISIVTQTDNANTNIVSNSSKIVAANDTKINDKKPCNETSSKVGIISDCDKKRNKMDNSTAEVPIVIKKIDNELKVKATVDAVKTGPKDMQTAHSKIVNANDTKINEKKPCNETSSKVGLVTDCDKKLNETNNSTTEEPNITVGHKIDDESKHEATAGTEEIKPKNILRTGDQKPLYDSLIHFGDMQINKEYQVYEVDSGIPAFFEQNENNKNERSSIEQPRYAPVYNYDPENAYFNAYNRLGPNEDDRDDDSETSDLGNGHEFRSKTLRMSKLGEHHKRKYHKKGEAIDSTTKPYYSKEESYEVNECKKSKENDETKKDEVIKPMSYEYGHIRHSYIKHKIFGYVPTQQERKSKLVKEIKYLYNNVLGKSTEEILDITKEDEKKNLRTYSDDRYDERLDASEDKTDNTRKDANNDKKIEVHVIDMNKNGTLVLRQGAYFSSRYKWDEEGNSFTNEGKVYNLDHIVPYSTEKSIILNQREESNKIFDRIKDFFKPSTDTNSAETVAQADPEDAKKAIEHLKNLDTSKTLFNKSSINEMIKGVENFAQSPEKLPPIPVPPRHFQYLKQRLARSRHQSDIQDTQAILRTAPCHKSSKCAFQLFGLKKNKKSNKMEPAKYKAPNEVLNSIDKITKITPEIDMLQNIQTMLQVDGFPIARSREDDLELYVRILRDMVKMDNKALEDYDWLGTTVAIQSALAKLREIIDQKKNVQRIHPSDLQLFKYVEALYTTASEVTKEKEGETLDEHIKDSKQDRKANNERMSLPKTHRKIKNPWKILLQISDLMKKKVLRDKIDEKTKNFEMFLDCMQQCLDDFHTAIKEITRITKYNQQRWYKNIKELYLSAGGDREYLEVLLHLYSMKLFTLIEESAENGAEVNYRMYMKDNRLQVDRTQAEMVFVIRTLKAIHDLRVN